VVSFSPVSLRSAVIAVSHLARWSIPRKLGTEVEVKLKNALAPTFLQFDFRLIALTMDHARLLLRRAVQPLFSRAGPGDIQLWRTSGFGGRRFRHHS
jgi:hypothetical protein